MICRYGCGREAKHQPKKGRSKWCCEETPRRCPTVRKSYGSPGKKNPMYGKVQSEKTRELISKALTGGKVTRTYIPQKIINENKDKCYYGCNLVAKYKLRNDRICCSNHQSSCMIIKNKIGKGVEGKMIGENHPMYRKTHSIESRKQMGINRIGNKNATYSLNQFLKKFPFFTDYEEIKEIKNKIIQVRCKECNIWFIPKNNTVLSVRAIAIKLKGTFEAFGNSYLFCSDKCKQNNNLYYRKKDPKFLEEYMKYKQEVERYTYRTKRDHFHKIKNSEFKKVGDDLDLDHMYSTTEGFKNNIDPKIISHWKNLTYIHFSKNRKKIGKCSITLEKLLHRIKEDERENHEHKGFK